MVFDNNTLYISFRTLIIYDLLWFLPAKSICFSKRFFDFLPDENFFWIFQKRVIFEIFLQKSFLQKSKNENVKPQNLYLSRGLESFIPQKSSLGQILSSHMTRVGNADLHSIK